MWVTVREAGTLVRIDPRTNEVVKTIRVGYKPNCVAAHDGTVWVTVGAGELQCLNHADMFGSETVRVRPVGCYGPHEYYSPYRGVIPIFVYRSLTGQPFTVHKGHPQEGHEWRGPDLSRGFHTYAVDWQPDHVAWYVDGVERARTTDPSLVCQEAMYLIMDLAVGGAAGAPDDSTKFPATMEVDYVRVWQNG